MFMQAFTSYKKKLFLKALDSSDLESNKINS